MRLLSLATRIADKISSSPCSSAIGLPKIVASGFAPADRSDMVPLSVIFKTECRAMVGFILSDNETTNNITRPIAIVNAPMINMPSIVASVYLKKSFIRFCLNRFYLRMSSTGQWSEPIISLRMLASTNRGWRRSETRK